MRILIASSHKRVNGAIVYANRIIPLLQAAGHDVWLAAEEGSWAAKANAGRAPHLVTDFRRWPMDEIDRVGAFCRRERIDLIHSHLTRSSNFAALLRARHGVVSVAHLHANHPQLHVGFHDLLIAVSRSTLDHHRFLPMGWGAVIEHLPNFVDAVEYAPARGEDPLRRLLGVPVGTPVFLQVGEICHRKGQDVAARAIGLVRRAHPGAVLALIGHRKLPDDAPRDGVVLLGRREDVPALMPHADVVLVPSRDDPFPLVALEALSCGVPVIASAVGGLPEALSGGGLLVSPADPTALAQAMSRVLTEDGLRSRLAAEARRVALERYSPESHLRGLLAAYRRAREEASSP